MRDKFTGETGSMIIEQQGCVSQRNSDRELLLCGSEKIPPLCAPLASIGSEDTILVFGGNLISKIVVASARARGARTILFDPLVKSVPHSSHDPFIAHVPGKSCEVLRSKIRNKRVTVVFDTLKLEDSFAMHTLSWAVDILGEGGTLAILDISSTRLRSFPSDKALEKKLTVLMCDTLAEFSPPSYSPPAA